jgi:hypothetical protein
MDPPEPKAPAPTARRAPAASKASAATAVASNRRPAASAAPSSSDQPGQKAAADREQLVMLLRALVQGWQNPQVSNLCVCVCGWVGVCGWVCVRVCGYVCVRVWVCVAAVGPRTGLAEPPGE